MTHINFTEMTDTQVVQLMQSADAINRARQQFSNATGFMDQAFRQRRSPGPIETRRLEFRFAQEIVEAYSSAVEKKQAAAVVGNYDVTGTCPVSILSIEVVKQGEGLLAIEIDTDGPTLQPAVSCPEGPVPTVALVDSTGRTFFVGFPLLEGWDVWLMDVAGHSVRVTLIKD